MSEHVHRRRRAGALAVAAAAALAAAGVAALLWPRTPSEPTPPARDTIATPDDRPAVAAGAAPSARADDTAREPARAPAAVTAAAPVHTFEVIAQERDEFGLEREPALWFGPDDGASTAYDGGFERQPHEHRYRWTGARGNGSLVVASGLLRRLPIVAGHPLRLVPGEQREPAWPNAEPPPDVRLVDQRSARPFGPALAPSAAFVHLLPDPPGGLRGGSAIGVAGPGHFGIAGARPVLGTLHGTVLTPNGEPAPDFVVKLADGRGARRLAAGGYQFAPMPRGTYTIEAGSRDGATTRATVELHEGRTRHDLRLAAGPIVRGRVVAPRGQPVAFAQLVWWTDDGDWSSRVTTAADGTFAVPTRVAGSGSLWACAPPHGTRRDAYGGEPARWPAVGCVARTGADDVVLVLDAAACRGAVRLTVPALPDVDPHAIAARLWQEATGLGMPLCCVATRDRVHEFAAIGLPAGHYTVELCCPAFGVARGGTFWCDGTSEIVIPRVVLPQLCEVTFVARAGTPAPAEFELVRTSVAFPSRLHTERTLRDPHHLAAGDYELWWRDGANENAPARSLAFTVVRDAAKLEVRLP